MATLIREAGGRQRKSPAPPLATRSPAVRAVDVVKPKQDKEVKEVKAKREGKGDKGKGKRERVRAPPSSASGEGGPVWAEYEGIAPLLVSAGGKQRGHRRGGDDIDPMQLVGEHRRKLAAQTSEAARVELAEARAELANCAGKRWLRLRAAKLRGRVAELRGEVVKIDSGAHVAEFERKAAPYLERFRRLSAMRRAFAVAPQTAGKAGRVVHTGTEVAPNTGVGSAAERSREMPAVRFTPLALVDDPRQAVMDALRVELLGEAPPLYIACGDICDDCGVPMKIISNHSMWGCPNPACGKTRKYDLMTAAAVGHGTELDYSSNTYHQKSRLVETLEFTQAKEYADPPELILRLHMEALWRSKRTALYEHAETIALDMEAHGEYVDAADAIRRLAPQIPDIEARLKADSRAAKARRCLREIARSAEAWLLLAHPELAGLTGQAWADAVMRFRDRIRKCYERSPKIAAYTGGFLPLQMRPDQEEYIRRLFIACGAAYDRYRKPNHQNNWPGGYPFFIRSILILLGLDEFVGQFPLPTGTKNQRDHEQMRQGVCREMDWEYIPSCLPLPPMEMAEGEAERLAALLYESPEDATGAPKPKPKVKAKAKPKDQTPKQIEDKDKDEDKDKAPIPVAGVKRSRASSSTMTTVATVAGSGSGSEARRGELFKYTAEGKRARLEDAE